MNDASAQIIDPILRYVIELRRGADQGQHPPLDVVRGELLRLFDDAEQRAAAARDTSAMFSIAKFALVYWTDEVLINSAWTHADAWRNHILEWEYFRENVGGEKFYEKAEEAERLRDTDPLEVFFLCMALGFQGRLGFDKAALRRWAERTYARVGAGNQQADRFLTDDDPALGPIGRLPGQSFLLGMSVLVSATALATLAAFILTMHQY